MSGYLRFVGVFFAMLFLLCLWLACAPRSEGDAIARINHRIWPEGHLTKTHLYVHWPAVYTQPKQHTHWKEPGGEEIVPAVTLKIPFEYLGQTVISFETAAKIARHDAGEKDIDDEAIDYYARVKTAVRVSGHQIVSIYLRFQPGAKPDNPPLIYKTDPSEVASQKLAYFLASYAVHIKRDHHFVVPLDERTARSPDKPTGTISYVYDKLPRIKCTDEWCSAEFGVKGHYVSIAASVEEMRNEYKKIDHSSFEKPKSINQRRWCINKLMVILSLSPFSSGRSCP